MYCFHHSKSRTEQFQVVTSQFKTPQAPHFKCQFRCVPVSGVLRSGRHLDELKTPGHILSHPMALNTIKTLFTYDTIPWAVTPLEQIPAQTCPLAQDASAAQCKESCTQEIALLQLKHTKSNTEIAMLHMTAARKCCCTKSCNATNHWTLWHVLGN